MTPADFETGFAPINGARLYYETAGSGPAVVLLHGFSLDGRMWDDQFAVLARTRRVLRYDLRGFGRSDLPSDEPFAHVDDLSALLRHLNLGPAAIVGLSMGGGVAIDFGLAYPDQARALVLVDAALGGYRWKTEWGQVGATARAFGVEAGKALWLNDVLFERARRQPAVNARLAEMIAGYSGYHWRHRSPERGPDVPAIRRLGEIRLPTLAVVGEHDLEDFRLIADEIARRVPGAQKKVLAGAGHMASMEAPEAFNTLLLDFLASVEASES